jgi:hypothetical protein
MALQNRSILGPANPFDNHLAPAGTAGIGGDKSLDRPVDSAPADGDQGNSDTLEARTALSDAYSEAQRVSATFSGSGAAGVQLGRGNDDFSIG